MKKIIIYCCIVGLVFLFGFYFSNKTHKYKGLGQKVFVSYIASENEYR